MELEWCFFLINIMAPLLHRKKHRCDPQKIENGVIVPFEHPDYGPMKTISSPFEVSGSEKCQPTAAPKLGEHTEEILREAGYTDHELKKFLDF